MSTNYTMFDPNKATQLAKFQGGLAGIQAGNASITGTAMAPTSIYNQAGYYALQNQNTGYVDLVKLQNESLYSNNWYDQGTSTIFDFTPGGSGITSLAQPQTTSNTNMQASEIGSYAQETPDTDSDVQEDSDAASYSQESSVQNSASNSSATLTTETQSTSAANENSTPQASTNTSASSSSSSTPQASTKTSASSSSSSASSNTIAGTQQYPWGPGYIVTSKDNGATTKTYTNSDGNQSSMIVDKSGEQIELDAADIDELVQSGIYDSKEEALYDVKNQGYYVSDDEEALLGIYSQEDEEKIQLLMDKFQLTREEAISQLGDKIQSVEADKIQTDMMFTNLINNGFTREEAIDYLQQLGYEVPEQLMEEPAKYSDEDETKIAALQQSTGCSREDAIKTLNVKEDKDGWLKSAVGAVGGFFSGIGKAISNGWNSFCDWIW